MQWGPWALSKPTGERDRAWTLLSHDSPRITAPGMGRVIGRLRVAETQLPLAARIRLGWFLTEAGEGVAGTRIAEGRIEMIATERADEFAFSIDAAALALQAERPFASLWLDLVREGEYWFHAVEGGGALRIDVLLPSPLLGSSYGMALLQKVLGAAGQDSLFHVIRRAEASHQIGSTLRRHLLDLDRLLPASRPPRAALQAPPREAQGSRLPAQLTAALMAREPWPAGADAEYFQRGRIIHQRTGLAMTQAMLDALALVEPAKLAGVLDNPDALRRWWLFEVVLAHPMPIEALPQEHRRHWLAPFITDAIAPANRWLVEAWEHDAGAAPGYGPLRDPAERLAFQLRHITRIWQDHRLGSLLGEETIGFWSQQLPLGGRAVSLFALVAAMALDSHAPLPAVGQDEAVLAAAEGLAERLSAACPAIAPLFGRAVRPARGQREPACLLGLRADPAAGFAMRMVGESLGRLGIAARIFDAAERRPLALAQGMLRTPGERFVPATGRCLETPTSLFFGEAGDVLGPLKDPALSGLTARRRIGAFRWAFAGLPVAQIAGAKEMDLVMVPSEFTREAFSRATNRPVLLVPPALELPDDAPDPYGALLAQRAEVFVFHSAFRPTAGLRQANPSAVIAAFQQAFPERQDVALVLRAPEGNPGDAADPFGEWPMILEAAAQDPRILLVEEACDWATALGYVRHADCVVSAHRSVGFGMLCAQAHGYGVPLIATGYSGNMEYCDAENTWLVEYRLRDIQRSEHPRDVVSQWADAEVDHLAAQMQAVHREGATAQAMAARGRARVLEAYAPARMDALLEEALR